MKINNLLGLTCQELMAIAESMGQQPFRGKQLFHHIYRRKQVDLCKMTDLAKSFRTELAKTYSVRLPIVHNCSESSDGTIKFLFKLEDENFIESVYIPEEVRTTLCISSQVGCAVGCTFCMTAQMGFVRNLRPSEIVGQVLAVIASGLLKTKGFNVVFMGMGEPLYNYQNVMKAFQLMTDAEGMDLSYRRITLSTSGVVPVLKKLAKEDTIPNLAISLNATTSSTRSRIMPINRKWELSELLKTCKEFPLEPRRRITIEYVLLKGETDSDSDAHRLARLLNGLSVKVNLIPYNANPGLPHESPDTDRVQEFRFILNSYNITNFVRKTRGQDVSAACGQLAWFEKVDG